MDVHDKAESIPRAPAESQVQRRRKSLVREYGEAIVIAILLALVIRTLVVQAFTIPSGSMMDTLLVGDYILVNKFLFGAEVQFIPWHMPGLRSPYRFFFQAEDGIRDYKVTGVQTCALPI